MMKVDRQLQESIHKDIAPVALMLSVLYGFFTLMHMLLLPSPQNIRMSVLSSFTSVALLFVRYAVRRDKISVKWAHYLADIVFLLCLVNSLAHMHLLRDGLQTTNVIIILIAAGFLFTSTVHLVGIFVISMGLWGSLILGIATQREALHFVFALTTALALSTLVHLLRVRQQRQLLEFNQEDSQRLSHLQHALETQRQAQKLKDELVSVVSHELRTPLTSLHGALGILREKPEDIDEKTAQRLLDIAHRNSERLKDLVQDLLDLGKFESGQLEVTLQQIEISELIEHAMHDLESYAQRFDVTFRLTSPDKPAWVEANKSKLMQVITNLLSNASKFSPRGSCVEIQIHKVERHWRIDVKDKGPGIPEDLQQKIFEPFVQVDASTTRSKEGTGLGLSISLALIKAMKGQLIYTDNPGGGSVFSIALPAIPTPKA